MSNISIKTDDLFTNVAALSTLFIQLFILHLVPQRFSWVIAIIIVIIVIFVVDNTTKKCKKRRSSLHQRHIYHMSHFSWRKKIGSAVFFLCIYLRDVEVEKDEKKKIKKNTEEKRTKDMYVS